MWRVRLGRIPVRKILDGMGIDLHSSLCPLCEEEVESVDHALWSCKRVQELWTVMFKWWAKDISLVLSLQSLISKDQNLWQATVCSFVYLIWSHRNQVIFKRSKRSLVESFIDLQLKCFRWISAKCGPRRLDWCDWLSNPDGLSMGRRRGQV